MVYIRYRPHSLQLPFTPKLASNVLTASQATLLPDSVR